MSNTCDFPDFYEKLQEQVEIDLSVLKNYIEVVRSSRDTDYASHFKFDYPPAYIVQGQHEAYQQMYCLNPPAVNKAVTVVCDWSAPPQVQFTLGDEYMHVVRQDPTGRFLGSAVITTYQLCSHNISHNFVNVGDIPDVTQL